MRGIISCNVLILFIFAAFVLPSGLEAAELRPFVLPSNQAPARVQQRDVQQRSFSETPSVYKQFEEDVRKMTLDQREKFKSRYNELYSQANQNGNTTEMNYYSDLLGILNRY